MGYMSLCQINKSVEVDYYKVRVRVRVRVRVGVHVSVSD